MTSPAALKDAILNAEAQIVANALVNHGFARLLLKTRALEGFMDQDLVEVAKRAAINADGSVLGPAGLLARLEGKASLPFVTKALDELMRMGVPDSLPEKERWLGLVLGRLARLRQEYADAVGAPASSEPCTKHSVVVGRMALSGFPPTLCPGCLQAQLVTAKACNDALLASVLPAAGRA